MRIIEDISELKEGDFFEVRELKVNSGKKITYRGLYRDFNGFAYTAHDTFNVENGVMEIPVRCLNKSGTDLSPEWVASQMGQRTSHVPIMTEPRWVEGGWYELKKLDSITDGGIKIKKLSR